MKTKTLTLLAASHTLVGALGFAIGIYTLPILIAPDAPTQAQVQAAASSASYSGQFVRELKGSDRLHWGEGKVSISNDTISLAGKLAPGPDYKLYLAKQWVETEAEVEQIKDSMLYIGDVKTFDNFVIPVPANSKVDEFNTVVVWCETFGEFITAAKYR